MPQRYLMLNLFCHTTYLNGILANIICHMNNQTAAKPASEKNILDYEIAIIGAGFAGVGAAIRLKMKGNNDFVIFEKAPDAGGTWRDNTYPGCGCDIPSFLYSYSFEPNPNWSHAFSKQGEILDYLKFCIQKYKIGEHIQYNQEITKLDFDAQKGGWQITTLTGKSITARVVIAAAGPFNAANIPNIKGKDSFEGKAFHSLHWEHDYDLKDKRIAVIGTGASAIQFVPEIAPDAAELLVYQRSAPYILPKPDTVFKEKTKQSFKKHPWYQRLWREIIYWFLEYQGQSNYGNRWIRKRRMKVFKKHLYSNIQNETLRTQLIPNYEIGCKRVLVSNDYYPTLQRDNVHLKTEGIQEIAKNGIIDRNGNLNIADVIIWGTGFYATKFPKMLKLFGLDKTENLFDKWNAEGPEAYYGMTVAGYPNLLFMVGPNSGLGHNSIIHMMESQLNYILDYLQHLQKTPSPTAYFDLKKAVQKAFNEAIQKKLSGMVWSDGGCKSYYLLNEDGKNTSIWPGSTVAYRRKTKQMKAKDYEIKNR